MIRDSPRSSPPWTRRAGGTRKRQPACTHLVMTRLFDTYDSHKCLLCRKTPILGWLYRCTQDHGGILPESDFTNFRADDGQKKRHEASPPTFHLSQWIMEAIGNGEYSPAQVDLLFAQRERVREKILEQEERTQIHSPSPPSDQRGEPRKLTHSLTKSPSTQRTSTALDEVQFPAHGTALTPSTAAECRFVEANFSNDSHPRKNSTPTKPATKIPQACDWKVCHSCRPTYRDRAYASIDHVLLNDYSPPPKWDLNNRRISDASIISQIDLFRFQYVFTNTENDQVEQQSAPTVKKNPESSMESIDTHQNAHSSNKTRFRATVREVLDQAVRRSSRSPTRLKKRRVPITACQSSPSSPDYLSTSTTSNSRSMLFRRHPPMPPTATERPTPTQVIDNRNGLLATSTLILAMNTPLPDSAEDVAGVRGGEVEVEEGVAVTEEAVQLSAADIIIQARLAEKRSLSWHDQNR